MRLAIVAGAATTRPLVSCDAAEMGVTNGAGEGGVDEVGVLAHHFAEFASHTAQALPLYRHLAGATAKDREVVGRLLLAHPDQRIPVLLFAAVHDVLLAGGDDPLAAWYASVTDPPRPVGDGDDDPWPHFRRLALEHPGVAERLATGATQTNEVGRCALLLPALAEIATTAPGAAPGGGRPLGLVDIGASAGLNLLLDRYGYRYEPSGPALNPLSPLQLECILRGPHPAPIPQDVPTIATAMGIDLDPVDLSDRDRARWLVACQWPDQPERIARARTAMALAHGNPPRVVAGDAVDDLAPLVEAVGDFALPVVTATWVLCYLPSDRREALLGELDRLGRARDLTFVFAEQPAQVPGIDVPPRPDGQADGLPTALVRLDWRDGARTATRLADTHPHGAWLEWLEPPNT